jgi:hypothetical protein
MREARIDGFVLAIDYRWLMGDTVRLIGHSHFFSRT